MGRFNRTTRLRTARFPSPGATIAGTVLSIADTPVPEFEAGRIVGPKFEADGTLIMQADVNVQTEDGEEFVIHTGTGISVAIGQALAKIGADDLHVGDSLSVTYVRDEDEGDAGINPTKLYEAVVSKPKTGKQKG